MTISRNLVRLNNPSVLLRKVTWDSNWWGGLAPMDSGICLISSWGTSTASTRLKANWKMHLSAVRWSDWWKGCWREKRMWRPLLTYVRSHWITMSTKLQRNRQLKDSNTWRMQAMQRPLSSIAYLHGLFMGWTLTRRRISILVRHWLRLIIIGVNIILCILLSMA